MSVSEECSAPVLVASRPVPRCQEDFADMFHDEDVLLSEGMQMHAAKHRLTDAVAGNWSWETDELAALVWQHYVDVHSSSSGTSFVDVRACPGHVINAR